MFMCLCALCSVTFDVKNDLRQMIFRTKNATMRTYSGWLCELRKFMKICVLRRRESRYILATEAKSLQLILQSIYCVTMDSNKMVWAKNWVSNQLQTRHDRDLPLASGKHHDFVHCTIKDCHSLSIHKNFILLECVTQKYFETCNKISTLPIIYNKP